MFCLQSFLANNFTKLTGVLIDEGHRQDVRQGKMRTVLTLFLLLALFVLIYSANFYFLSRLNVDNSKKAFIDSSSEVNFSGSLDEINVKNIYKIRNQKFDHVSKKILKNFAPCDHDKNYSDIWSTADKVMTIKLTSTTSYLNIVFSF